MKTLRKQLETVYADLDERYTLQQKLYEQNEKLWEYTQSLLELNKKYGIQTMAHIEKMKSEFGLLKEEREHMTTKLEEAQQTFLVRRNRDPPCRQYNTIICASQSISDERAKAAELERELERQNAVRQLEEQELAK